MGQTKQFFKKHPGVASGALALVLGGLGYLILLLTRDRTLEMTDLLTAPVMIGAFAVFFAYPLILTAINVAALFYRPKSEHARRMGRLFEYITVVLGWLFSMLAMIFTDVRFDKDWQEVLVNVEVHAPIWTQSYPTVFLLCMAGVAGYLILSIVPLKKLPPLAVVLSMAAMYMGGAECVLWIIQMSSELYDDIMLWMLLLFPANCIILAAKTIRYKMAEWREMKEQREITEQREMTEQRETTEQREITESQEIAESAETTTGHAGGGRLLGAVNRWLDDSARWPVAAFLLMWPLLGVFLCVLLLFGQRPDYLIRSWTETAQWTLSGRTAPPNVYHDEHYLCTVAAGGHEKVVKPLRMGERHGHRVVVNRQLCVANAFEQILEERTPRFHRRLRHFYDTYGFPVARLIRTKLAADVVYVIMKPLEWLFLTVLYLCDTRPEDRIATQYLPREIREKCRRYLSQMPS